jgi:methyl-accepting chemotaxis protein
MKIQTKVNLILIIVFITGIFFSGMILEHVLKKNAENEVSSRAEILMQMVNSVRKYTNDRVQPLLLPQLDTQQQFIPESIPSYSVREVFELFRKNKEYRNFLYKDATLNPTSLRDKADEFETKIVEYFIQKPDSKPLSGYKPTPGEKLFYIARPFKIEQQSCLRCHNTPEEAPKSQIATYGNKNGFGWKLNQIVAAQIVYVPALSILNKAHQSWLWMMGVVGVIFTAIIIVVNQLLKKAVLLRIKKIANVAEQVSVGDMNANFDRQSKDEIGDLAEAFNRMKYSLEMAMNMLNKNRN